MIAAAPPGGAPRRWRPAPSRRRAAVFALLFALAASLPPAAAQQTFHDRAFALLGGMDKVTGRISSFALPVDVTGSFGTLEVTPRACRQTPPDQAPESAAFLHVRDWQDGSGATVFSGWMFASTPGLSALEHPVYDIWVIACANQTPHSGTGALKSAPEVSPASASASSAR